MKITFLVAVLLLLAHTSQAADLRCQGLWGPATSEQTIRRAVGSRNIRSAMVELGEGEKELGTVVFPDDPARKIEILWADASNRRNPQWVRFTTPGSNKTYFGITIGTTLDALRRINGKPFLLTGFQWDYSGTVTSWEGGAVATTAGNRCRLLVRLEPSYRDDLSSADRRALKKTAGDREFSSDDPNIRQLNPRVYEVRLLYR